MSTGSAESLTVALVSVMDGIVVTLSLVALDFVAVGVVMLFLSLLFSTLLSSRLLYRGVTNTVNGVL